jgi:Domain of unknown function (DUF4129)
VVDSERLREEAERILSQRRYRTEPTTSESFGEWLERLWYGFLEFVSNVAELVGGPLVLGLLLFGLVVLAAVLITRNLGHRRAREIETRILREHLLARGADPADLEREAEKAALESDFATALRLTFRAGLLRLDERGRIRYWPGLTSAEVSELLASPEFESLARRFDEVVYGHRTATAGDFANARQGWDNLLNAPVPAAVGE